MAKNESENLSFIEHLSELRRRIIYSLISVVITSIISYIFYPQIIKIITTPYKDIEIFNQKNLFIYSIYEGFIVRIKIAILGGIILGLPFIFYNIIKFIFPALTLKEKRILFLLLFVSFLLALFGIYYGYYKVIPISIKFLASKDFIPENVGILLNFNKNIFFIFQLILAGVIIFQAPLLLVILMALNIIKRKTVVKYIRHIIVIIFIISAILTPPDVMSQILFALPLIILFFLAILVSKIFKFGE